MSTKPKIPGWPQAPAEAMANFANPLAAASLLDNPLTNSLAGGFDFVKTLWGGLPAAVPGFIVPTVDLDELDKRIKDLKTVESWLAINASMLRATVQSLEVQRNTIAAIKSIGASLTGSSDGAAAQGADDRIGGAFANWPNPEATSPSHPSADTEKEAQSPASAGPVEGAAGEGGSSRKTRAGRSTRRASAAKPDLSAPGQAASSWLAFLQEQFNQVAQAAVSGAAEPKRKAAGVAPQGDEKGALGKAQPKPPGGGRRARVAAKSARTRS